MIKPRSPTLQVDSLPSEPPGEPIGNIQIVQAPQLEYWAESECLLSQDNKRLDFFLFLFKKKVYKMFIYLAVLGLS